MANKKIAVIDLGTNTFHLLIAEVLPEQAPPFKPIFRERRFIKLAEDGIATIGDAPYQRALDTLISFRQILSEQGLSPDEVKVIGTAALRTASNGADFIAEVFEQTKIKIELIDGLREAELIYKGARLAVPPMSEERNLIMDIGGGSVEFIIANGEKIYWSSSFPIGVAVLFNTYQTTDPISAEDITGVENFLIETLRDLFEQLKKHPCSSFIGASGTFDVLVFKLGILKEGSTYSKCQVEDFYPVYESLIGTSLAERLSDPDIPDMRAEMLVVALILVRLVLDHAKPKDLYISNFALKEGLLSEIIDKLEGVNI